MIRQCNKCGEWRPFSAFGKQKKCIFSIKRICILCSREEFKKYYAKNRQKVLEKTRKWRAENLEKRRESDRMWRAENLEKKREMEKKYWDENTRNTSDIYIMNRLCRKIEREKITHELIELKRLEIKLYRAKKQLLKEQENGTN